MTKPLLMLEDIMQTNKSPPSIHISKTPSSIPSMRYAVRLLTMVHELHKAGYQHLRICAGHSLDSAEWRCYLMPAKHMYLDGWTPHTTDRVLLYTSSQGKRFFGWTDTESDSARDLAIKFVERYPDIVSDAVGQDWAYVGWLTSILGDAERGHLPSLFGGYYFETNLPQTKLPPTNPVIGCKAFNNDEYIEISHESLSLKDLPTQNADYVKFCLSFDGYRAAMLMGEDCESIAENTERNGFQSASMESLRITAFIRQRAIKWSSIWPPNEKFTQSIRDVINEIRLRVCRQASKQS